MRDTEVGGFGVRSRGSLDSATDSAAMSSSFSFFMALYCNSISVNSSSAVSFFSLGCFLASDFLAGDFLAAGLLEASSSSHFAKIASSRRLSISDMAAFLSQSLVTAGFSSEVPKVNSAASELLSSYEWNSVANPNGLAFDAGFLKPAFSTHPLGAGLLEAGVGTIQEPAEATVSIMPWSAVEVGRFV